MRLYGHSVQNLHPPGLRGLLGLGDLSLSVSTPYHVVGQQFVYYVRGGPPNAQIFWSSQKDGLPTGENNAFYGHLTDSSGNADLSSTPGPGEIGNWIKTITVKDSAGTPFKAAVAYNVAGTQTQIPATQTQIEPAAQTTSVLDNITNLFTGLAQEPVRQPTATGRPIAGGTSQAVPSQPGFLSRKFQLFGFQIPYFVPIAIGTVFLLQKKR